MYVSCKEEQAQQHQYPFSEAMLSRFMECDYDYDESKTVENKCGK